MPPTDAGSGLSLFCKVSTVDGVRVGVGVSVGVLVSVGVGVSVGVAVCPRAVPDAQANVTTAQNKCTSSP